MVEVSGHQIHRAVEVDIGVSTHKDQHVAVAVDGRGVCLGESLSSASKPDHNSNNAYNANEY